MTSNEMALMANIAVDTQKNEVNDVIDKIIAEIVEYKDDKIIHAERNEMIDIVLDIIDKYKTEREEE